ncbi:hypothetical protein VQ045_21000 [Aurantimonas sp. E1-2-R+4]|uniref:hypothetical protein n=1 Tax=Aurantimonas sp. E1-2-R+4 TaxID=3113714 RepID=UPI002F928994
MITIAQLATIPYLDTSALDGRFLATLSFYDNGWRMWLAAGEQREQLIEIKGEPAEACYFAAAPVVISDLYLPFFDFLSQRANYLQIKYAFSGIKDDLFNLSGSLAKLALLDQSHQAVPHGLSRMATSEVEYIVMVMRSLFDLFQEAMVKLWDRVTLLDASVTKCKLKPSFADMLRYKGEPSSAEEIASRFGLPINIAACYARGNAIFDNLKRLRDNLVHQGSPLPHIFGSEAPFLIARRDNPFPEIEVWHDDERRPNDLVPLLPVLETLIYRSFRVCDELAEAFASVVQFPPPVAPDMAIFARGDFTDHLVAAIASGAQRTAA